MKDVLVSKAADEENYKLFGLDTIYRLSKTEICILSNIMTQTIYYYVVQSDK